MASTESSDSPMALRRACVSRLLKPASTRMRARLVAMKVQFPELLLARIQTLTISGLRALSLNKQDRTWGGRSLGGEALGRPHRAMQLYQSSALIQSRRASCFRIQGRVLAFMNRKY